MIGVSGEPTLAVEGVERRFGAVRASAGVDVDVAEGELLTILGPSGSGKTTLLHVIAGFETLDRGTIYIGGHDVTTTPPARREIGMVFQNYALFPHMTVSDNIAFPLAMRRTARAECAERVRQVLDLVALRGFGKRYPAQLSGGQQQRVTLARAIVFRPKVLLLDEPFGALDRQLRESMQLEVRRLQQRLGLATIFITHDQEEALIMSDRIAVMRDGQLKQIAPDEIYTRPTDAFVAEFVGESNLISGRIERIERGNARIAGPGDWKIMAPVGPNLSEGEEIAWLLRPEIPRPRDDTRPCENSFLGRITETIYLGNSHKYRLECAKGLSLLVRWPASASRPKLPVGREIEVVWSAADGHVLRRS